MEEQSAEAVFIDYEKEVMVEPKAGISIEKEFLPAHIAEAQCTKVESFLGGDQTDQAWTKKADPGAGKGVYPRTLFHQIDAEPQQKGNDHDSGIFGFYRQHENNDGVDIWVDEAEEFHFVQNEHLSDPNTAQLKDLYRPELSQNAGFRDSRLSLSARMRSCTT